MKPQQLLAGLFLVVFAGFGFYTYDQNKTLQTRIDEFEKTLKKDLDAASTEAGEERRTLQALVEASGNDIAILERRSEPGKIAKAVLEHGGANLVAELARILTSESRFVDRIRGTQGDPGKAAAPEEIASSLALRNKFVVQVVESLTSDADAVKLLRGEPGSPADPKAVASELRLSRDFTVEVAMALWMERREELTQQPELIADVAKAVFDTYRGELRGESPEPLVLDEIAGALVREPYFLEMVAALAARNVDRK